MRSIWDDESTAESVIPLQDAGAERLARFLLGAARSPLALGVGPAQRPAPPVRRPSHCLRGDRFARARTSSYDWLVRAATATRTSRRRAR